MLPKPLKISKKESAEAQLAAEAAKLAVEEEQKNL
jgi:hypothetical protein